MNEQEAREAVRPHGNVKVIPSEDESPGLSPRQEAWIEEKAEQGWPQIGPCRWLPGGCLVVECQGLWGPETFVLDREGNEL